jgi:3-oxoacyl-[acyl-carrier-protein] synthase-3
MKLAARMTATGAYLPERVLTNAELERLVDTSDDWIVERTGIRERRIAGVDESSSTLGTEAALRALASAGVSGEEIDLVIAATCTPDGMFPAVATRIQHAIGAVRATSFDVNAACTGFLSALMTGAQFIQTGSSRRALIVGTETMSRIVDWTDRGTCVLFGDGAGAVLLEPSAPGEPGAIDSMVLVSDGSQADSLYATGPCAVGDPLGASDVVGAAGPARDVVGAAGPARAPRIVMDGRAVFRTAVQEMTNACQQALAAARIGVEQVKLCVPHQANERILSAVARNLGLPMERMFVNLDRYGNTSSATIPVALTEANEAGLLQPGDRVLLTAIGGGVTWGAAVVEWAQVPAPVAADAALAAAAH